MKNQLTNHFQAWMFRLRIVSLVCISGYIGGLAAAPIIAVDMNPLTAGIQNNLTVNQGSIFTVDVVISDNGFSPSPSIFDTVILELLYNDAGAVLGAGPTGLIGGALASNSAFTFDGFGFVPSATGVALTAGPSSPSGSFTSGSGAVSLLEFFPSTFNIAPGSISSIFSLDFISIGLGTSTLLASGSPSGSPELALFGSPVSATLQTGTVTVVKMNTVPAPSSMVLLLLGLLGLISFIEARKKSAKEFSLAS